MSLDVYLNEPSAKRTNAPSGIFVRENGVTREISRAEWDARNPGREPHVVAGDDDESDEVFHGNITHNLTDMARAAGLYDALWRPNEHGIEKASQLAPILREGLARLEADPDRFDALAPSNGWGSYGGLVEFVRRYLAACEEHPEAGVSVWR